MHDNRVQEQKQENEQENDQKQEQVRPRQRSFLVGQRHFKGFCHFTFDLQRYNNVSIGKTFDLQRFLKGF